MSTNTPVAFIDGNAAPSLLKTLKAKKAKADGTHNTYFAHSAQASMYGIKVNGDALPNGLQTVISVAVDGQNPVVIPTTTHPKTAGAVQGEIPVVVNGKDMFASAYIKDHGDGTFQLRVKINNKRENNSRVFSASEVFAPA